MKVLIDPPIDLVLMAGASLGLAWLAGRRHYRAPVWFGAGWAVYFAASQLIRWLTPDAGQQFAPGKQPGATYALWSKPSLRSDFGLTLVVMVLAVVVSGLLRRLRDYADETCLSKTGELLPPPSPTQRRASAIVSAVVVVIPLVLWVWAVLWFVVKGDYSDIVLPVLGFVALVAISGGLWYRLEGFARHAGWVAFTAAVILAQLRFNATRPPGSMFESNGSVPFFLPLLPIVWGVLFAQSAARTLRRRQYVRLGWQIGGLLWGLALVGWLVKFMGFYDYQNSFAFDLGSLFAAPIHALAALSRLYYEVIPRSVAEDRNFANMDDWETGLAFIGGVAAWLGVWAALLRRPAGERRTTGWQRLVRAQFSLQQKRYLLAFGLLLPAVALRTFTTFYPFMQSVILSVQKYNPAFPPRQYVGFRNFERLSTDLVVRESLEFTLIFVFVSTFFQVTLGLAIAHLLNANFSLRGLARTISLIPWAVPMVVAAIGFKWMFDDQFGMIPDLLERVFGYEGKWLVDPENARVAVIFVSIWKSTPFAALLLLAGLQGVSLDLYEAAKVDGANWLDSLRFITIPMLMPIIVTITMFMLVWQLAVFDLPFAMTGGAPGFSTTVVAQKIYLEITSLNYSYASAISITLVVVVTVIGGIGLYTLRRVEVSA